MASVEQVEAKVADGGTLTLPPSALRALGVAAGDTLAIAVDAGEVRLRASDAWIDEERALLKPYLPYGRLLSDELIADRRAENARDEWEHLRDLAEFADARRLNADSSTASPA